MRPFTRVFYVVLLRSKEQMVRIYAERVITTMKDADTVIVTALRNRCHEPLVHQPMSQLGSTPDLT